MTIISNNRLSPSEACSYVELRSIFIGADVADVDRKGNEVMVTYVRADETVLYPRQLSVHTFTCPNGVDAERWKKLLDLKQHGNEQQLNLAA